MDKMTLESGIMRKIAGNLISSALNKKADLNSDVTVHAFDAEFDGEEAILKMSIDVKLPKRDLVKFAR